MPLFCGCAARRPRNVPFREKGVHSIALLGPRFGLFLALMIHYVLIGLFKELF